MRRRERVEYKTPEQVALMRRAGLVVADALAAVAAHAGVGTSTGDLDAVAAEVIAAAGATPSFLGYQGYPKTLCVSVNEEVVHGIPGERRLVEGDVVSVDCGAIVDGWHGDAAVTVVVGGPAAAAPADLALVEATRQALWDGIAALRVGGRLGDVGAAVEDTVSAAATAGSLRLDIVDGYVGHGIGSAMHQAPEVLNHRTRSRGMRLRPGLCVAVEPMVACGDAETDTLPDDWTVVTRDGSRAAHWEHTVALGPEGLWVLTAPDGGEAELAERGVRVVPLG